MLMDLFMQGWQVHTQCASILRHKLIKKKTVLQLPPGEVRQLGSRVQQ